MKKKARIYTSEIVKNLFSEITEKKQIEFDLKTKIMEKKFIIIGKPNPKEHIEYIKKVYEQREKLNAAAPELLELVKIMQEDFCNAFYEDFLTDEGKIIYERIKSVLNSLE